jgi:hypothetical protein
MKRHEKPEKELIGSSKKISVLFDGKEIGTLTRVVHKAIPYDGAHGHEEKELCVKYGWLHYPLEQTIVKKGNRNYKKYLIEIPY